MKKVFLTTIVYFSSSICLLVYAQTFPGGVKPFEERSSVEKKVPEKKIDYPSDAKFVDNNTYKVSIEINIQDIILTNVYFFFEKDKLVSAIYDFKNKEDRPKILSMLKRKYKTMSCTNTDAIECFKGVNMKIELANKYIIYRSVIDSEF